ncbi:MAG: cytochrome P450 [Sphingobium sp.]
MALYSDTMIPFRKTDTVPDNVPAERIFNWDVFVHGSSDGDYAASRLELRGPDIPEMFWTPFNGGHWVATRADNIDVVVNNSALFGYEFTRVPKEMNGKPPFLPLQVDPPHHTKYRNLLMSAFSPNALKRLASKARELTIDLIEGFVADGHCDFVHQYARVMPIGVFMSIVDYPMSDRLRLIGIVEKMLRGKSAEERFEGYGLATAYLRERIAEREANPRDDLISQLVQAEKDGVLVRQEVESMMTLLLTAGIDTVASMFSNFARFLALNPGHRQQLIDDPSLIPGAVEELLRRFAIVTITRLAMTDVEMGGVTVKAGDLVVCPAPLRNLDEDRIADPLTVDFRRKPSPNATFGGADHRCMGSMLARTELRIFLEEWLKRIPDFAIAPGAEVVATADITSIIPSLPLVWPSPSAAGRAA